MNGHEYLIEQISNNRDNSIKLDFNHPINEISYLLKLQNIQKYNKDNKDIDNLCVLFNKLEIYNSIENKWYLSFLEIKI